MLLSVSKKPDKAEKKQKVQQDKVESLIKQTLAGLQIQEQQTAPDLANAASTSQFNPLNKMLPFEAQFK